MNLLRAGQCKLDHDSFCPGAGGQEVHARVKALLESCQNRHPELVRQVLIMVEELERISMLWEEQWQLSVAELEVGSIPPPLCIVLKIFLLVLR